MAFVFAYNEEGGAASDVVVDVPLDTVANYKNSVGTNSYTQGDAVTMASGLLKRSKDVTTPPAIYGVLEGIEFLGLSQDSTLYPVSQASFNAASINTTLFPNGVGKVRVSTAAVYKVAVKSGQTAAVANRNVKYGLSQDAAGDQTVDLTNTTNAQVTVKDFTPDGKFVYVKLS